MPQTRQNELSVSRRLATLELLPQPVVAHARDLARGDRLDFHRHRRAQLVYASHGLMRVTTRNAAYLVPPQRAVWMPGGVEHRIDARSRLTMRTLYVSDADRVGLPNQVCVLQVTRLLRELILAAVAAEPDYAPESPTARLMTVILDQIEQQPRAALALPLPTDPRLQRIVDALIDNPADARDLGQWAAVVGASTRTLVRLFPAQTGMTFRQWRQQRRLLHALELLAHGNSVTTVAMDTGYDNCSAFIAMFKRCTGMTPLQYLG